MNNELYEYLDTQKIGVVGLSMPDGSLHAATIHFANNNDLWFFFATGEGTKKSEALLNNQVCQATFVVGTDASTMKTFQAHGEARLVNETEQELFDKVYFGKFADRKSTVKDPKAVYFLFITKWWRYSDFKHPKGKLIISSDDK